MRFGGKITRIAGRNARSAAGKITRNWMEVASLLRKFLSNFGCNRTVTLEHGGQLIN